MDDALGFDTSSDEEHVLTLLSECDQQLGREWLSRCELMVDAYSLGAAAGRAEFVVCEIAATLLVPDTTAGDLLAEARLLLSLPALARTVETGRLRLPHAHRVLSELVAVDEALHEAIIDDVLDRIADQPPAAVGRIVRRAALRADPGAAEQRRKNATKHRGLALYPARDGMVDLVLNLDAEVGVRIFGLACAATEVDDGTGRSADARRSDWIVEQILRGPSAASAAEIEPVPDGRRRRSCQALVTISVTTALGLPEHVRQALLSMIDTPSMQPTEAEQTVQTRTPRCDFPCCSTPATRCDLDHTRAWPRGSTSADNLAPRSRRHHRAKQAGWTPCPLPDGSTQWNAPSGRTYVTPPAQ